MSREIQTAKVLRVDLDEPLLPLRVEPCYGEVVLVVLSRGKVLGQIVLPPLEVLSVELQWAAIGRQVGEALWRQELEGRCVRAIGGEPSTASVSVSVVVCTRDRPEDLKRCLESLLLLDPAPDEILVVDNSPTTEATRDLCTEFPVRYVLEPLPGQSRARNRGIAESVCDVVAFTDDDCVVEPAWLAGLAREFNDQRVMAVTGVVAPVALETASQYLFEAHGGFGRGFRRRVFDGVHVDPSTASGKAGAGANAAFRRRVFDEIGPFSEWLGPGTPARAADDNDMFCRILAAGHCIVYDPGRLVWHRHRADPRGLRDVLFDYGVSSAAFATQRLLLHRDRTALRIIGWWWLHHVPAELWQVLRRRPSRVPFRCVLAEMRGTLVGPWRLWRSLRSRRSIDPIVLPESRTTKSDPLTVLGPEVPSLSVVIPSANRRELLRSVLAGLAGQRYPAERFEAIVVLDGTSDDSAEMLRSIDLPFRVRIIELPGGGIAAARNAGVLAAAEPVVHFLDDDIVPESGCLATHAAAHQRSPRDHVVLGYCPPVVDGSWWGQVVRAWWEDHYRRKGEPGHRWSHVDFTTGNSSLPHRLLLDLGGFDEAFRLRHEDWELAVRLLERGVPFRYYPETIARHHLDLRLSTAVARQRREARDDIQLARLHPAIGTQLPLAAYRRGRPPVDLAWLHRGIARAARLERKGRLGTWRRDTTMLLRDAYVAGLRDELPSEEAFQGFLAELMSVVPTRVEVNLDGGAPPIVPAFGPVEIAFLVGDAVVARVPASSPGVPWDWGSMIRRVEREASDTARLAVVGRQVANRRRRTNRQSLGVAGAG